MASFCVGAISIELLLQFRGDALDFVHDSQQVAAPDFLDLSFGITAAEKLQSDVEGFAGVIPADDAAAAVEIGRDADMVDANELHGMIDVIDEVFDRGGRIA